MPLRDYPRIVMGHGGGGKLSSELVEHLFLPAFGDATLARLGDAAVLEVGDLRLAFSTDTFVVNPLFFPGGDIGELAINGTVNDLAMMGARPLYLSAAFVLEEGFATEDLARIAHSMGRAARAAGVRLVTGDTKVVERGHGHGVYINTAGIGLLAPGCHLGPDQARLGDVVLVSGPIGNHGMAIMSVREGLEFETTIKTDSAPLSGLVEDMLAAGTVHALRDPTRGGVASALNELARASQVGIVLSEADLPVDPSVASACELLGLDPLFVANEGKLVAIVPERSAPAVLAAMQAHPLGQQAALIGRVTAENPGIVAARTPFGGTRVVDTQVGEQLPRIC
ncbi:MAG: hydrogenase expression/formation protein HypE [Vulcanimicrobiota bacterium]